MTDKSVAVVQCPDCGAVSRMTAFFATKRIDEDGDAVYQCPKCKEEFDETKVRYYWSAGFAPADVVKE